jgi:hypothetical protein
MEVSVLISEQDRFTPGKERQPIHLIIYILVLLV